VQLTDHIDLVAVTFSCFQLPSATIQPSQGQLVLTIAGTGERDGKVWDAEIEGGGRREWG